MQLANALKGIGGDFELNRVIGAFGATAYILCPNIFEAWEVFGRGQPFNLVAYCASFPIGLGAAVGSIAGAVALKDRNVAQARVTAASATKGDAP